MVKKNITIEKLAEMIANGFEQTATKDDLATGLAEVRKEMHERFAAVDERFDRVELHISSLGSDWRERFDALEMRVRKLEHKR